jgi:hypothetical protein
VTVDGLTGTWLTPRSIPNVLCPNFYVIGAETAWVAVRQERLELYRDDVGLTEELVGRDLGVDRGRGSR